MGPLNFALSRSQQLSYLAPACPRTRSTPDGIRPSQQLSGVPPS
jgi:hypothetical protein